MVSEPQGPFLYHMFCLLLVYVGPGGSSQVLVFARQAAGRLSYLISQAWETNSFSSNLLSPKECADKLNFVPFCHVFLVLVPLWMPSLPFSVLTTSLLFSFCLWQMLVSGTGSPNFSHDLLLFIVFEISFHLFILRISLCSSSWFSHKTQQD